MSTQDWITIDTQVVPGQGAATIEVTGEIDATSAVQVARAIHELANRAGVSELIVDLEAVSFIDSTGVSVLLGCHDELERDGTRLTISAVSPRVLKVLDITGLSELLLHPALLSRHRDG
jgi:anti-sigma B factor antagonist